MAAAALLAFSPLANPKFSANLSHRCVAKAPAAVPRFSLSYRRSHVDALSPLCVDLSLRVLAFGQNTRRGLSIVASYDDSVRFHCLFRASPPHFPSQLGYFPPFSLILEVGFLWPLHTSKMRVIFVQKKKKSDFLIIKI